MPSFMIPECDFEEVDLPARHSVDFTNATSIREAGEVWKKRAFNCWTYEGFRFEVEDEFTGGIFTYNFLEYSGTRQLAEDIQRVSVLFGDQALSIYGISYGTKVMGTFATMFPGYVNLMVLDGNDDSGSDITVNIKDIAESNNYRIDYLTYSCTLLEIESPGACPIEDLRKCITQVAAEVSDEDVLFYVLNIVAADVQTGAELCAAVDADDFEEVESIINAFYGDLSDAKKRQPDETVDTPSKPTTAASYTYQEFGSIAQDMVTAQDYTNGAYSDDMFVRTLMDLNEMYPGAGTQKPVRDALQWVSGVAS